MNELPPFWKGFLKGLKPDPILTLDAWADEHRFLSGRSGAEAGRWRTARTPYLREIMRELSVTSETHVVVFKKGAQIGGTEVGLNWMGYVMAHVPGPMLAVQPTVELAKRFSKQRINPLIEESPSLRGLVRSPKERDSGNNILSKEFPGGILLITGANSAVGLRSMPARYIMLDEVDAYPANVDDEGDPVSLAIARTRTFKRNYKVLIVSTPTIQGHSTVDRLYDDSDQRRYHVPCPFCEHYQTIDWKRIKWEPEKPETAKLECEECRKLIDEHYKTGMLARGRWVAERPSKSGAAGFHLSSLYSPLGWYSWGDCVKDFLAAKDRPDKLRTFVNTVLGEVWIEKGDAPDWRRLYERRETFPIGKVPRPARLITAGVDVQKDRLEAQVVAWGPGKEAWAIDYRIFPGDTADLSPNGPWQQVRNLLQETWKREDGMELSLQMAAVDSGYNTQTVYDFVRAYPANRVIATKGEDSLQMLVGAANSVDVQKNGKRIRRGVKVWKIGASLAKTELYGLLRLEKPTDEELQIHGYPPGFIHFPQFGEEYFRQITAEQLMRKVVKGFTRFEWAKVYERNEALDTFIMARCAAAIVGIDRFTVEQWAALNGELPSIQTKEALKVSQSVANTGPRASVSVQRRKSTFW